MQTDCVEELGLDTEDVSYNQPTSQTASDLKPRVGPTVKSIGDVDSTVENNQRPTQESAARWNIKAAETLDVHPTNGGNTVDLVSRKERPTQECGTSHEKVEIPVKETNAVAANQIWENGGGAEGNQPSADTNRLCDYQQDHSQTLTRLITQSQSDALYIEDEKNDSMNWNLIGPLDGSATTEAGSGGDTLDVARKRPLSKDLEVNNIEKCGETFDESPEDCSKTFNKEQWKNVNYESHSTPNQAATENNEHLTQSFNSLYLVKHVDSASHNINTSANGKADGANAKTDLANCKTDSPNGKTDSANGKTDLANGKTNLANGKTDLANGKTDLANGKTNLANGMNDLANGKTNSAKSKTNSLNGKTDPEYDKTDSSNGMTKQSTHNNYKKLENGGNKHQVNQKTREAVRHEHSAKVNSANNEGHSKVVKSTALTDSTSSDLHTTSTASASGDNQYLIPATKSSIRDGQHALMKRNLSETTESDSSTEETAFTPNQSITNIENGSPEKQRSKGNPARKKKKAKRGGCVSIKCLLKYVLAMGCVVGMAVIGRAWYMNKNDQWNSTTKILPVMSTTSASPPIISTPNSQNSTETMFYTNDPTEVMLTKHSVGENNYLHLTRCTYHRVKGKCIINHQVELNCTGLYKCGRYVWPSCPNFTNNGGKFACFGNLTEPPPLENRFDIWPPDKFLPIILSFDSHNPANVTVTDSRITSRNTTTSNCSLIAFRDKTAFPINGTFVSKAHLYYFVDQNDQGCHYIEEYDKYEGLLYFACAGTLENRQALTPDNAPMLCPIVEPFD